jgi:hypothetical protein
VTRTAGSKPQTSVGTRRSEVERETSNHVQRASELVTGAGEGGLSRDSPTAAGGPCAVSGRGLRPPAHIASLAGGGQHVRAPSATHVDAADDPYLG